MSRGPGRYRLPGSGPGCRSSLRGSRPLPQSVTAAVQPPSGTRGSAHAHPPTWARPRGAAPRPQLRGSPVRATCTARGRRRPGPAPACATVSLGSLGESPRPHPCPPLSVQPHCSPAPSSAATSRPREGDALSSQPAIPRRLGWDPPETAGTRPAGGGRRLYSRGAPPAVPHSPPFGAHPGQVAAGAFWGARLCHWWIFLNPAGGGGERSALPAAAPAAPALPPLLSAATARLAPGGPARSSDAEMKVLGHRLQLLTGTAARRRSIAAAASRRGAGSRRGGPGWKGHSRVRVPSGAKPEAHRGSTESPAPVSGRVERLRRRIADRGRGPRGVPPAELPAASPEELRSLSSNHLWLVP